ncbi:hypothetical protein GN956_G21165 [Arapaima gigas]
MLTAICRFYTLHSVDLNFLNYLENNRETEHVLQDRLEEDFPGRGGWTNCGRDDASTEMLGEWGQLQLCCKVLQEQRVMLKCRRQGAAQSHKLQGQD